MVRGMIGGVLLATSMTGAVGAAEPDMRNQALHRGARNELGLLEYCQARGFADPEAVSAQRRRIEALPPVTPGGLGEQEEMDGRAGYLAFDGRQAPFAASASAQGLSLATACAMRALSARASG